MITSFGAYIPNSLFLLFLDGIELFLCPELNSLVGVLLNLLQQVGAVDKILLRIQKCHASPVDFLTLSATLKAAVAICNVLTYDFKEEISNTVRQIQQRGITEAVGAPPLGQIASRSFAFLDSILERCYVPALQDLYERITSVVDEEMTAQVKDSLIIQHGFNEELDNAKAAFDGLSGKSLILDDVPFSCDLSGEQGFSDSILYFPS